MSKENNEKRTLMPRLRFPEFRDAGEWKAEPLRKLAKRCTSKNAKGEHTRVLTNSAEYGVVDQRDYFEKDIANQGNLEGYYIVEKGDYVYNPRMSASAPVGPISKNNVGVGVMSPLYTVFRFASGDNDFFAQYFKSTHWHHYMLQASSTGARHDRISITNDSFMDMPLPVSTPKEQQKIADCLSSLDELITAETQKLDAIKAHKAGLIQQLFPREGETVPRLRFPEFQGAGEWEESPIGNKVDLLAGYPFSSSEITDDAAGIAIMRGINVTEGYVRHSQEIDRYFVGVATSLEKYRLCKNDLIIGMDGSKVGKNSALVSEADEGSLLIQRVARLRAGSEVTIRFIFQYINSERFHSYVDRINTSGGIPHISARQINEFSVCFPAEEEQRRIVKCLSSLDDQITAQSQKLDHLKIHRKGLMQQIFPVISEVQE